MIKHLSISAMLCMGLVLSVVAQEPVRPEIDLERFAEDLFQVQDEDINYEDLYESLLQLYSNPINLNTSTKDELGQIFSLSIEQINNLYRYRQQNGPLLSLYELQAVPGFDQNTISKILPFIEIQSLGDFDATGPLFQRILKEKNNYFMLRTERILEDQSSLFSENEFKGSPYKLYGRFRTSHSKDFSMGFTFEKDQGEEVAWSPNNKQYGFDYYSFHFLKENTGNFRKIIVGDYQMQFGQGLIMGAGFNPGKGAETITTVRRSSPGIKPYTSVLEAGFFRGAAATYRWKSIDITSFYSRLKQDANILGDTTFTNLDEFISSVQSTGFHRSDQELARKDVLTEQNYGMNLMYRNKSGDLQVGVTAAGTDYSVPIIKKPNNYNQFEFNGTSNYNIGAFFNYNWENFLLFGEAARSKSGGLGMVGGFIGSLSPIISVSMVLRNYERDFHTFYGNSFGESSRNINEKGIYWGLKVTPSKKYFITAYYDKFSFPWLRFRAEAPSQGYEYLIRFNYKPSRAISLYAQMRTEGKERTVNPEGTNLNRLEFGLKRNYIVNMDYKIGRGFSLKSRVQYSNFTLTGVRTKGIAVIQDLNFEIGKFKLSSRIALIDTEDSENRQYTYEKNVLYAFSIPSFAGQGVRNYIMVQYKPTRKMTLWVRYARINFLGASRIITNNERVTEGNTISDLKLQVRYKF